MRRVRVLIASCHVRHEEDASPETFVPINRRAVVECLKLAKAYRPDFVCFSEIALHRGKRSKHMMPYAVEELELCDEPMRNAIAELNSHVILGALVRRNGKVNNDAALIGRDGSLIGTYSKYQPTGYEMEQGVSPGQDVPVWETDCGRVGCAICFDLKFPKVGLALSRAQAQLVFWPTMFLGGRRLKAWSLDYGFHMAACHNIRGEILNPNGQTIAISGPSQSLSTADAQLVWTFAEINTDHKTYHLDFNQDKLPDLTARYGPDVDVSYNRDEGTFVLTCNLPDKHVEDIEREFELQDLRSYLDATEKLRDKLAEEQ